MIATLAGSSLVFGGCFATAIVPENWPVLRPQYPRDAVLDYAPVDGLAHAALPPFDLASGKFVGQGRIWLKGSPAVREARLVGGPTVELGPPHFVAVLEAAPGPATVELRGAQGPRRIDVVVPDPAALNEPRERLTLLSYACFDPFDVLEGRPTVRRGDRAGGGSDDYCRLHAIRELLRDAAAGSVPNLAAPDLLVGAGDQVYVEPAHGKFSDYDLSHPLSAWTVEEKPRPRLGLDSFVSFLDATYRSHWSFTTLDEVFRRVPSCMIWDDHEIRDGWGSQGDEHVFVDTYYAAAREAFVQHQFTRGPRPWDEHLAEPRAPLHQALSLHGLPVLVLDQRSARDVSVPQVLGNEQWAFLRAWLARLDPAACPYYVLVSPLPILYRVADLVDIAAKFDAEVRDDLLDNWCSDANTTELDALVAELLKAWERGLSAIIISGDMHTSAILRATCCHEGDERECVFAYEVVVSGLAGPLDADNWKHYVGREGAIFPDAVQIGPHTVRMSLGLSEPSPNFGAVEIASGEAIAHLFQATEADVLHYRIPLRWGADAGDFDAMVESGRRPLRRRPVPE